MPTSMPSAPPYLPSPEPPYVDQWPPPAPPPWPPLPPGPPASGEERPSPNPHRGRGVALVVATLLLSAAIGMQLGGTLFGSPSHTATSARTSTLPTPGAHAPAAGNGLSANEIAARVDPAVAVINTTLTGGNAAGTGMVLTSDGLVVTNNHVIADSTSISVQLDGQGTTYSGTVLGYDITDDVALVKLDGASNLPTVTVGDSATVAVGDHIVALGNALGRGGTPAVAEGDVTDLDQTITASDTNGTSQQLSGLIEINARLLPGDSGGPVVNSSGQVVAMNAAASATNRRTRTSDGFAIPIDKVLEIARQIETGQGSDKVHIGGRALLGVQMQDTARGATVANAEPGSPAESAGITAGDVITSVDGTSISSVSDLPTALDRFRPGDSVSIGWTARNGQAHTASVTLTSGPPA